MFFAGVTVVNKQRCAVCFHYCKAASLRLSATSAVEDKSMEDSRIQRRRPLSLENGQHFLEPGEAGEWV